MSKKRQIFYYITLLLICLVPVASAYAEEPETGGSVISESQKSAIVSRCSSIKDILREVQREDAKIRVALGGYYETILTKFIVPLNVRLVENNLSSAGLVENQNDFAKTRTVFSNDFIGYQKELEEVVGMDCKTEPEKFYEKLEKVRQKRKIMNQDTLKMRSLLSGHIKNVGELMGEV